MNRIELDVSVREDLGKGAARRTRASGQVPAILYGSGTEPLALRIEKSALDRVLQSGVNSLIDLKGPAQVEKKIALVKELQRDPVNRSYVHCDLFVVDTRKKLHVGIPIVLAGKPVGVELGGVLEPVIRELDVTCLPLAIPDALTLDVGELGIGDALHVSDIEFPEGVETAVDQTLTVVHVVAPRVEEEEAAPEEEEAAEAVAAEGEPDEAAPETPAEEGGES